MKNSITSQQWLSLVRKDKLQEFQDSYAKLENISMIFLDSHGKPLTTWSNRPLVCVKVPMEYRKRCVELKNQIIEKIQNTGDFFVDTCFMGMLNFAIPVFFNDVLVAYCFGGGVFPEGTCNNDMRAMEGLHTKEMSKERMGLIVKNMTSIIKLLNIDVLQIKKNEMKIAEGKFLGVLSKREVDVVECVCDGLSNKEIAKQLFISERTVKTHIYNIMSKLEVSDRVNLLLVCEKFRMRNAK